MKHQLRCFIAIIAISLWVMVPAEIKASPVNANNKIKNPYFPAPVWKLWRQDESPVWLDLQFIKALDKKKRLYPVTKKWHEKVFIEYRPWTFFGTKTAGMWDDVYINLDKRHSYILHTWGQKPNRINFKNQFMHLSMPPSHQYGVRSSDLWKLGTNFTSQSTTHMGHDLTDSYEDILTLERNFYFTNSLRAGPAHSSYHDIKKDRITDKYDAIVPVFFNSVGSSSSEVKALTKMMIVGSYLPVKTKAKLKLHGLYIATLLYIWKASLPYDVPYENELRHRVAYAASGDNKNNAILRQVKYNQTYHLYDEEQHLRNMLKMAEQMEVAPPVALLRLISVESGTVKSANKSTIRVYQKTGQTVRMKVSVNDSYDLDDRELSFKWSSLYENVKAEVKPTSVTGEYEITLPFDLDLPRGRTTLLLTVNNGQYDSNPATINIYRDYGNPNLRPSLTLASTFDVQAGSTIQIPVTSIDPEGFPTKLYQWAGEVGHISNETFIWHIPLNQPVGSYSVSIITSDGTGSYNSQQITLNVGSRAQSQTE